MTVNPLMAIRAGTRPKAKNAQDTTVINNRKTRRDIAALERRVKKLEKTMAEFSKAVWSRKK